MAHCGITDPTLLRLRSGRPDGHGEAEEPAAGRDRGAQKTTEPHGSFKA